MKTKYNLLASVVTLALAGVSSTTLAADIESTTATGQPSFVSGNLGSATPGNIVADVRNALAAQPAYGFTGNENFTVKKQWVDSLGKVHTRLQQNINGIPVYGTSLTVHGSANIAPSSIAARGLNTIDSNMETSTEITAISGTLATVGDNQSVLQDQLSVIGDDNFAQSVVSRRTKRPPSADNAMASADAMGEIASEPELAYIYLPESGETKLSWKIDVANEEGQDLAYDQVFFDTDTTEVLTKHSKVYHAKTFQTYNYQNRAANTVADINANTPLAQLLCTNTQACSDASAQRAKDGASSVYDYYKNTHNRNGINGSDLTMRSYVHAGTNLNNAFWFGDRMYYGDGDGNTFRDLTFSHDVIAHELTHGVTEYSANLVYLNESGALNEAMSDIMGASADAFRRNSQQPIWKIGADVYTPNTPGDALRYMNNPTQDGSSKDYYPTRYTGTLDKGGVHWNSGIANLAYVLLVDGGSHPRGVTNAVVPKIGLAKAEKIFYRALTTYFNQNTNFAAARTGTAQAAQDLYGASEKTAVETAWCAVGVGACPSTGGGNTGGNTLENGVAKTGLSGSKNAQLTYTIDVPAGATNISFNLTGGSGDADLYVKFGSAPGTSSGSYDCRSWATGNTESCAGTNTGGTYHVLVNAYAAFSGASLTASYTASTGGGAQAIDETVSNVSVGSKAWTRYTQELGAGYKDLTVTLSGGTGDADLYIRHGARSTTSTNDCKSESATSNESCKITNPASGTWYIDVYGYSAASGITLNLKAN